jgi:hypothetical protein
MVGHCKMKNFDRRKLALEMLQAKDNAEVLVILQRYGFLDADRCPTCIQVQEARHATIE